MYDFVEGQVVSRAPGQVVLECGGIGYALSVSLTTYGKLDGRQRARLYAHLHVREDCLRLYGFFSREERELFRQLTSVSTVGPEKALKLLSALPLEALRAAVASADVAALSRVKGVGGKTAERIAVELRDKVAPWPIPVLAGPPQAENVTEALAGLASLGYSGSESKRALDRALAVVGAEAPVEALIREALKHA